MRIQTGEATEADRLALYRSLERFCRKIANQYMGQLTDPEDEIQDLLQEAYMAIMDAAMAYDEAAGMKFIGWASFYIRNYYVTYIGNQTGRSRSRLARHQKILKYEREFVAKRGREATDEEVCEHFHIMPGTLLFLRHAGKDSSLNEVVSEDDSLEKLDQIPDPHNMEEDVCEKLIAEEVRLVLRRFLDDLPEAEREAVIWFYLRGQTYEKAAAILQISVKDFRKNLKNGLEKLRSSRIRKELGRYFPERVGSMAYDGFNPTQKTAIKLIDIDEFQNWRDLKMLQKTPYMERKGT